MNREAQGLQARIRDFGSGGFRRQDFGVRRWNGDSRLCGSGFRRASGFVGRGQYPRDPGRAGCDVAVAGAARMGAVL